MNVTRNPSGYGSGKTASDRFDNGKKAGALVKALIPKPGEDALG